METLTETRTNMQVIQDSFAEFLKGNISGIINNCTDDIVWQSYENPIVQPSGTFRGKQGVIRFFSTLDDKIEYSNFEPKEYICQGSNVVVLGHHTGKVKATGKTFDHDWCMVFKLRDKLIYSYVAFVDTYEEALAFQSKN